MWGLPHRPDARWREARERGSRHGNRDRASPSNVPPINIVWEGIGRSRASVWIRQGSGQKPCKNHPPYTWMGQVAGMWGRSCRLPSSSCGKSYAVSGRKEASAMLCLEARREVEKAHWNGSLKVKGKVPKCHVVCLVSTQTQVLCLPKIEFSKQTQNGGCPDPLRLQNQSNHQNTKSEI